MKDLLIWKTHPEIPTPRFETEDAACFDLAYSPHGKSFYSGYDKQNKPIQRNFSAGTLTIMPGDRIMVPTGIVLDIPDGHSVRIHPRSGQSLKKGLTLVNAEGVIDADYVQEVFILMTNISDNGITLQVGERVAQGELVKNLRYAISETGTRPNIKTSRTGGMGSTDA